MKKSNMKSINKQTKSMLITYAMVIAVFIIVEIMISTGMMSSLMQGLLVPLCIYSIVAIGLNLCVGYLGELSLGHAGFMCVGAFSSAVFSKCMMTSGMNETLRFILALLIGTVVAAVFGWLIGIPVLRLRGDYLAIVTLAFGEIIKNIKAQDDEYLLQTLTGKDGELCPVHNKKPSIFPIPGRDDDDDGGSGSWQDWWDKLRP